MIFEVTGIQWAILVKLLKAEKAALHKQAIEAKTTDESNVLYSKHQHTASLLHYLETGKQ